MGTTYTLDARTPSGRYATDRGLTAEQVANARRNAPRLGIEILAIFRDDEPIAMSPDAVRVAFGG